MRVLCELTARKIRLLSCNFRFFHGMLEPIKSHGLFNTLQLQYTVHVSLIRTFYYRKYQQRLSQSFLIMRGSRSFFSGGKGGPRDKLCLSRGGGWMARGLFSANSINLNFNFRFIKTKFVDLRLIS